MKFLLSSELVQEAMAKIDRVLKAKSSIPILSGVLFEAKENCILLTASDGTESIIHRIPVEDGAAIIEKEGTSVFSKDCLDVVKKLKGLITFEAEGHVLKITQEKTNLEFSTLDPSEYPKIAIEQSSQPITFSGKEFGEIVSKTAFAVATSEVRPILQGVNMTFSENGNVFSSTDSHRLAQVKSGSFHGDINITVPAKTLVNAVKSFDLSSDVILFPSDVNVAFANRNTIFYSRLLEGAYPDTSRLIPREYDSNLVLNKKEFQESLELLMLMTKNDVVKLKVDGLFVEIIAIEDLSKGSRQLAFESYDGDENFVISFSAKFVSEALKTMESTSITIGFNGNLRPFVIRPVEEDLSELQLVLPVRMV